MPPGQSVERGRHDEMSARHGFYYDLNMSWFWHQEVSRTGGVTGAVGQNLPRDPREAIKKPSFLRERRERGGCASGVAATFQALLSRLPGGMACVCRFRVMQHWPSCAVHARHMAHQAW